jgi:hypothetical protein
VISLLLELWNRPESAICQVNRLDGTFVGHLLVPFLCVPLNPEVSHFFIISANRKPSVFSGIQGETTPHYLLGQMYRSNLRDYRISHRPHFSTTRSVQSRRTRIDPSKR